MVSMPYTLMYSQKHGSNLAYPASASAWYPNYSTHHASHHPNNQFLNAAPTPIGSGPNGILDSDTAAASFYERSFPNHHHHMLHSSSPDWSHDYNLPTPSAPTFFSNGMTPPTSLHLSPTINSHHSSNSANASGDNLQNGLQNVPPSPPITEMSSPGIGSNGNSSVIAGGDTSPNMNSNNNNMSPKTPYEWMKKPSYQSQPNSGLSTQLVALFFLLMFFIWKSISAAKMINCHNNILLVLLKVHTISIYSHVKMSSSTPNFMTFQFCPIQLSVCLILF